jgi:hypothetical protein
MWSYIFLKAFLIEKEQSEYSGNDTYLRNMIDSRDVSWFPMKKALKVLDDEEALDDKKKREIGYI